MKLSMKLFTKRQSHYIEVAQAAIFMERNMRFWADFGPVGNTEKWIFHVFMGKKNKNFKKIVASALKSCIKLSYNFFSMIHGKKKYLI